KATWKSPTAEAVREQIFEWLSGSEFDDEARAQAEALWESTTAEGNDAHLLDLTCATFALVGPQARDLVSVCSRPREGIGLVDVLWLVDGQTPAIERANLRLLFARWLVQESLYDEAQSQLEGLKPEDVVDPAALLFYQGVVNHRLLNREAGLQAIG